MFKKTGLSPCTLNFLVSRSRREGEAEERSEIPSFHQVFLGSGTTVISSLGFYNKISHTHEGTLFDSFLDLRKNIVEVVSHNFDHYQQGEQRVRNVRDWIDRNDNSHVIFPSSFPANFQDGACCFVVCCSLQFRGKKSRQ